MSASLATGLAITNPLVKYRALVATKSISPDNSQLRLAVHLQKLYEHLKDYEPQIEYSQRLDQISRSVSPEDGQPKRAEQAQSGTAWRSIFSRSETRDSSTMALTRKLTSYESAMQMNSPKGLMLHGEVGTGKSMLVDLFADCLPNRKKRRWHFNTFMLETFAKLESFRRSRPSTPATMPTTSNDDYSLMWLAKDMIQTSPIIFLDEFQMPDRASSKILTNLMTSFFHLGGVLIATSNRMPEELAKASGIEFSPPPSRMESLGRQLGLGRKPSIYAGRNEFANFLDVLKARCEVWEMDGSRDYRRMESGSIAPVQEEDEHSLSHEQSVISSMDDKELDEQSLASSEPFDEMKLPTYYLSETHLESNARMAYESALRLSLGEYEGNIPFAPGTMNVYGRTVAIPRTYHGVTEWTFTELCRSTLGPADYITLASMHHTFVIRDVPVLTSLMKNEARRFITLLDALYECRCKLFITADAGPDHLFFPDKEDSAGEAGDSIQSETFSEAYQDATAPFRPNILTENPNYREPDPEPNYTHARLAGLLNADALEDGPPNKPGKKNNPFGRSFGRTDAEMERQPVDPDEPLPNMRSSPDFGNTSAFVGEDERFAYKRAQSRLWEMCGARWWAREEEGWHRPLPLEARSWERSLNDRIMSGTPSELRSASHSTEATIGEFTIDETRDESMFKDGGSPFRTSREPPPKFSWVHAWGTMKWGRKAGAWGQGVDGLNDRDNEKK